MITTRHVLRDATGNTEQTGCFAGMHLTRLCWDTIRCAVPNSPRQRLGETGRVRRHRLAAGEVVLVPGVATTWSRQLQNHRLSFDCIMGKQTTLLGTGWWSTMYQCCACGLTVPQKNDKDHRVNCMNSRLPLGSTNVACELVLLHEGVLVVWGPRLLDRSERVKTCHAPAKTLPSWNTGRTPPVKGSKLGSTATFPTERTKKYLVSYVLTEKGILTTAAGPLDQHGGRRCSGPYCT